MRNLFNRIMIVVMSFLFFAFHPAYSQNSSLKDSYRVLSLKEAAEVHPDSVKAITLRRKRLRELPTDLSKYKNLEYLDISRNRIRRLPANISELKKLRELNLQSNPLESIPATIVFLSNLKILKLGKTNLNSLPPEIGQMKTLEYLDLWGTFIHSPPEEIALLSKTLKVLDMRGIKMNPVQQQRILQALPFTDISFSRSCNCNFP